jgi:hypothetical protein
MMHWWREFAPGAKEFKESFSPEDIYKIVIDESDSFHACKLSKKCKKFLKLVFKLYGELKCLVPNVAVQGFNLSALFYPVWVTVEVAHHVQDTGMGRSSLVQRIHG